MTSPIADNLARVRDRMAEAALRAGRSPEEVTLVAVSKIQPAAAVREAFDAGQRVFGENYVQEAIAKMDALPAEAVWHMVGRLQSNKAKVAAARFRAVQTVDSPKLARALERHAAEAGKPVEGLIQLNWSREAAKAGIQDEAALRELIEEAAEFRSLRIVGLMTIPDPEYGEQALRRHFAEMRQLRENLAEEYGIGADFSELSMGMSRDYEWAIEEGATIVRVGTAIFGARP